MKSRLVLVTKGTGRRQLAEILNASANCTKAAEDTTKELVEACLESPNERVSSVSTVEVLQSNEEEALTFFQDVTIESEVAVSFDDLIACIDESVVDNNATETLRSNAKENRCDELEEGFVESLTFTEEADTPTSTPSSPGKSSDVSSSPTSTPSSQGESSDVSSAPAGASKSGKSSSTMPGVTKASKKSEASSKSSKSVKSANTEPQENAKLDEDEVEEVEESIALGIDEVEEPKESAKLDVDEEEDPEEVTEDEEVETEEEGLLYVLAKMLGGWW